MPVTRSTAKAVGPDGDFLVGTAISVWQNSGGGPSNWETWQNSKNAFGLSPIEGGDKVHVRLVACLEPCARDHCSARLSLGCSRVIWQVMRIKKKVPRVLCAMHSWQVGLSHDI